MDYVSIPREALVSLYSYAMYAPPSSDRFAALSMATLALNSEPRKTENVISVSRPVGLELHKLLSKHRDQCDIGRAEHLECTAAALVLRQLLGITNA